MESPPVLPTLPFLPPIDMSTVSQMEPSRAETLLKLAKVFNASGRQICLLLNEAIPFEPNSGLMEDVQSTINQYDNVFAERDSLAAELNSTHQKLSQAIKEVFAGMQNDYTMKQRLAEANKSIEDARKQYDELVDRMKNEEKMTTLKVERVLKSLNLDNDAYLNAMRMFKKPVEKESTTHVQEKIISTDDSEIFGTNRMDLLDFSGSSSTRQPENQRCSEASKEANESFLKNLVNVYNPNTTLLDGSLF